MPILDHFDFLAPIYDKVFKPSDRAWLLKLVDPPAEGRLLDAGGGTGRISQLLVDVTHQVVVADLSEEMLRQTWQKTGLEPACALTETLPFPDNTFDRCLIVDALHHVYDHKKTALELLRVVKPGGRLVIEEPDIRTFGVKLLALMEKILLMRTQFIAPPEIARYFDGLAAVGIRTKGVISWVIVDKSDLSL